LRTYRKLNIPLLVSHITQHAAGRDPLFIQKDDYVMMLGLLKECAESFRIRILAFCLMTNHVHILLQQQNDNLPAAMKFLFQTYAGRFNRRYGRSGHLFKSSYRQLACFDGAYALSNSVYIHLNPVRAGMVEEYREYQWSSWRLYCRVDAPVAFVDAAFLLSLLGENREEQVSTYCDLLSNALARGSEERFPQSSAVFALDIWKKRALGLLQFHSRDRKFAPPSQGDLIGDEALEAVLGEIARSGGFKGLKTPTARLFAVEQLEARGYRLNDIADMWGISLRTIMRLKQENVTKDV